MNRTRFSWAVTAAGLPALLAALLALCPASGRAQAVAEAVAQAASQPTAAGFDQGLAMYEVGHYEPAFRLFARLADKGHPEAARLALQMWRYGPRLYRVAFTASASQVQHWETLWGCGGDATSLACQQALQAP